MPPDDPSGARPAPVVLRIKLRYDDVDMLAARFAPNVGKSGLFLPTKSLQAVGAEVKFELRLADDKVVITGLGRVKAAKPPDPDNPRATFGMAIELTRVTRESRDVILKILAKRKELGLPEVAIPHAADIDAAKGQVDTGVREASGVPSAPVTTVDSAPILQSGPVGESTRDSAPILQASVRESTRDSAPILHGATRESTRDSAPILQASVRESTRDSAPVLEGAPLGGESAPVLTAPRRASGPIAIAKVHTVEALAPEAPRKKRPAVTEIIERASGPVVVAPELDENVDVGAVLAMARSLAGADLDAELEALREGMAAPVEISIDAASAELARQLGGLAVRRDRSAGWAPPPRVEEKPAVEDAKPDGAPADAATPDAARADAATPDAARDAKPDTATSDAAPDATTSDVAPNATRGAAPNAADAAAIDAAAIDAGAIDAGAIDAGAIDAAPIDAGAIAAPAIDAAAIDGATVDAAVAAIAVADVAALVDTGDDDHDTQDPDGAPVDAAADAGNDRSAVVEEPTPIEEPPASGPAIEAAPIEPPPPPAFFPVATPAEPMFALADEPDDVPGEDHEVDPAQIADEIHQLGEDDFEEVEHTMIGGEPEPPPAVYTEPSVAAAIEASLDQQLADADAEPDDLGFDTHGELARPRFLAHPPATLAGYAAPETYTRPAIEQPTYALPAFDPSLEEDPIVPPPGHAHAHALGEGEGEEEIDDFEILAEADAEDADLLTANAEQEASGAGALYGHHADADFAARLELSDEHPRAPEVGYDSAGAALAAFDDEPSQYQAETAYEPMGEFTLGGDIPADDFDSPHADFHTPSAYARAEPVAAGFPPLNQFDESDVHAIAPEPRYLAPSAQATRAPSAQPRKGDDGYDLETALEALDVDLDDLSVPHAKTERGVTVPPTNRPRTASQRIPAQRAATSGRVPTRNPKRPSTDDGVLIDFDDDDDDT